MHIWLLFKVSLADMKIAEVPLDDFQVEVARDLGYDVGLFVSSLENQCDLYHAYWTAVQEDDSEKALRNFVELGEHLDSSDYNPQRHGRFSILAMRWHDAFDRYSDDPDAMAAFNFQFRVHWVSAQRFYRDFLQRN